MKRSTYCMLTLLMLCTLVYPTPEVLELKRCDTPIMAFEAMRESGYGPFRTLSPRTKDFIDAGAHYLFSPLRFGVWILQHLVIAAGVPAEHFCKEK